MVRLDETGIYFRIGKPSKSTRSVIDAILERERLSGDKLVLYAQKAGTPVWVPLPKQAVEALNESPSDSETYCLWNDRCQAKSAVKIRERTFQSVFNHANITDRTIHRFRDTFAVELLPKGAAGSARTVCAPSLAGVNERIEVSR